MTLVYFILILGVTVLVHELGHFIFAKRSGVYVYEFAIGMGPKLYSFKRKNDETVYSIRLIPLGGFCQLAGEEIEPDENIPDDKRMQSKTWVQRFLTIIAGCLFNFLFAFILLLIIGLFYGAPELKPYIGEALDNYPAKAAGMENGDLILSINGEKMPTSDDVLMKLELVDKGSTLTFEVKKTNGEIKTYNVAPKKEKVDKTTVYKYGMTFTDKVNYGVGEAIKFAFVKFGSTFKTMGQVIGNLITGNLGLNNLAGPVGIYNIVGEEAQAGFESIIYLIAFLSINIGFVNFLPFPAFDGGRLLFLVIEKIKGSRVNPRVENIIHAVGFALLLLLMLVITIQDISKLM
jgi:regulator of sigma E protease